MGELKKVVGGCKSHGKRAVAELIPEDLAVHSEKTGGATKLAEVGAPPWVIQRQERWASQAFAGYQYVRSNVEDPVRV